MHLMVFANPTESAIIKERSNFACIRGDISPISSNSTDHRSPAQRTLSSLPEHDQTATLDRIFRYRRTVQRQVRFARLGLA